MAVAGVQNRGPIFHKLAGWGPESAKGFDPEKRPFIWPFLKKELGLTEDPKVVPPVPMDEINPPPQKNWGAFRDSLGSSLRSDQVQDDKLARLLHAHGKSFRDLWKARRGRFDAVPDVVVFPESENEVAAIVDAAAKTGTVLIPFGGGTNVAGCLDTPLGEPRPVAVVNLTRLNRVFHIDPESRLVRCEAGIYGPALEEALGEVGMTLGHFPDSFLYSTVGGWVATRSSGMLSDGYGNLEDMVVGLHLVTARGVMRARPVPKSAAGINLNHLCCGSEGTLGIITEVTLRIRPAPAKRVYRGTLFPDFSSGIRAIKSVVDSGEVPVMMRLNDPFKTALSFAFKEKPDGVKKLAADIMKAGINRFTNVDTSNCCLMLTGYEGDKADIRRQTRRVNRLLGKAGGVDIGTGVSASFDKSKFDFPHLRDFAMDRGLVGDISETATHWGNVENLYEKCREALFSAGGRIGKRMVAGCHVSHSYDTGCSLYFTFGWAEDAERGFEDYLEIKSALQSAFVEHGGTLSHHHAVGTDHLPWLMEDVSPIGVEAMRALKAGLDAERIMNPGKLDPVDDQIAVWRQFPKAS